MMTRLLALISVVISCLVTTANAADYRISDAFKIEHQSVGLRLDPDAQGYSGSTTLTLSVKRKTDHLELHWSDLEVGHIALLPTGDSAKARELKEVAGDDDRHSLDKHRLSDGSVIKPGNYTLTVEFRGDYSTDALGLYKSSVQGSSYLFTQFEAMFARRVFPMVDEPDTKIPWEVTISAPDGLKVASNTPVTIETRSGGWTTRKFAPTPPMPSYLLAFIVGDFDVTPVAGADIPVNIWSTKGTAANIGYSAKVTPGILKALENYFGIAYPYKKLDFVAVPDFTFGAMENAGLITYRSEMLLNGDNPSPDSAFTTAMVIAHELAHQWYGNLVTMAWWDDLWLNEAFASWMAYKVTNDLHPEFRGDLFLPQDGAFSVDALAATRPIRREITNEEDVTDGLGLNYSKGHSILNMLEQAMGESAFQAGIRQYMKKHQWKNTVAADLWAALESNADFKVGDVAETFLNQSGFPLIQIEPDGTLTQRRFENAGAGLAEQIWRVPMAILVGNEDGSVSNKTVTLAADRQPAPALASAPWLLPTAGGNGYFVWYTDAVRYAQLQDNLQALTDREQLALLVNAKQLLAAGVTGMDQHMALTALLSQQPNEELVLNAIEEIRAAAEMYRGTHLEPGMRRWVSALLNPWYESLGIERRPGDSQSQIKLRARVIRVLAQLGENPALLTTLSNLAERWLQNPDSIDPGIAREALRMHAMFQGDASQAQRYIRTYENSDNAVVKSILRTTMYFTDRDAVDVVLKALASGRINAGDMASMVSGLFYANVDQEALYQSWQTHFDGVQQNLPEFYRSQLPQLTSASCNATNLQRQQAFYRERGELFGNSLRKSIENANNCVATLNREIEVVDAYLSNQ